MIIGVAAVILKVKRILLIKRGENAEKFPNIWGLPGGKKEENETPEEAAIREVKEETSLDFIPERLLMKVNFPDRIGYRYIGKWKGEVKIKEPELSGYGWFTYEEAVKLELAFDHMKTLEKLHEEKLI